jgi:2-C-methyl-D-erythritol 4-phosphate cytidylyltransferase
MNNATNDLSKNRQGDDGLTGTFTMANASSFAISNTNSRSSMRVILYPQNASAATLQQGTNRLYFDGTVTAGTDFTLKTAAAGSAAGTEMFAYELRT